MEQKHKATTSPSNAKSGKDNTGDVQETITPSFPNKSSQWKPGQSGNPKGKPKGALHLSTHIQNMLNDESFETWIQDPKEGVIRYKGLPMQAIIKTAMTRAVHGDATSREWLAKYGYGSKLEIENSGEQKMIIETRTHVESKVIDHADDDS